MTPARIGQLMVSSSGIGIPGDGDPTIVAGAEALFDLTRADELGRYRPLTGARTLPAGWFAPATEALPVEQAIEVVYPLALTHRRQYEQGSLRVVALDAVLRRQSGRYEETASLDDDNRRDAVRLVCGECVRRPVWDGSGCGPNEIPCPEPCSVMVSFCREAAIWQQQRPAPAAEDRSVAWAAFDVPGNELRERYLRQVAGEHE
jgi:hypothetical protein